jgi:hypothetical protein
VAWGDGASRLTLDTMHLGSVGGEMRWETPDFGVARDRYDIEIAGGANRVRLVSHVSAIVPSRRRRRAGRTSSRSGAVERIVVGIDGSEAAAAVLRWAIPLARALDAEVIVVHVVELTTYDTRPLCLPLPLAVHFASDERE